MAGLKQGMVHLYHGDGKGKTTAAMGLALRATGRKKQVLVVQFLKQRPTGEVLVLETLPGVRVLRGKSCGKFLSQMNEQERADTEKCQMDMLSQAMQAGNGGTCDLLVLDEVLDACNAGLIDPEELCGFLHNRPAGLEVVLTGRNPGGALLELADYISHVQKQKHPYEQGISAREGIEF